MRVGLGDDPVRQRATPSVSSASTSGVSYSRGYSFAHFHLFLALPFLALLAWAGLFLYNHTLDNEQNDAERPVFSQMRPVRADDLSAGLQPRIALRYGPRAQVRLDRYRGRTLLAVVSDGKIVRRRNVIAGDLDQDAILRKYRDATGDQADTAVVRYKRGRPFVYVYSSNDVGE